jgi:hypothetical protein
MHSGKDKNDVRVHIIAVLTLMMHSKSRLLIKETENCLQQERGEMGPHIAISRSSTLQINKTTKYFFSCYCK